MPFAPQPLAGLVQDARYAVRTLARRPGFAAAVVLTIALAVGVNVAIFGVVRAALLRPLPYAEPERLVHLWSRERDAPPDAGRSGRFEFSYPDFLDVRERSRTLSGVAGYQTARLTLQAGDRALVLPAARVTANIFDVLGVAPVVGRRFEPGEDAEGAPPVAMLGYALWQRAFGGDRSVVGRVVELDGMPYTVVGVLPERFAFAGSAAAEVWAPIDRNKVQRERRTMHWLKPVARLEAGVTHEAARADLARVMGDLAREHPASNRGKRAELERLHDEFVGVVRPLLLVLYGAVAVVLLVACGNVANLLLMRGAARERELAIRAAIGAGRGRIARQLLVESSVLALAGAVGGVLVAWGTMRALVAAIPVEQARRLPYLQGLSLDAGLLGYALLVALVAGALSGLAPVLRARPAMGGALQATLRRGTAGATGGAARAVRDGLVVAQLAFAVVLLAGTALFAGSLARLLDVRTGVQEEGVLTMMVPVPRGKYDTQEKRRAFYRDLESRVAALPGVTAVGVVTKLPLDAGNSTSFTVVGAPPPPEGPEPSASFRITNPGYFRAMGIPLLAGSTFANEDTATARVILVNRTLVREAFGTDDVASVVGRRLATSGGESTIIGVVGDVAIGELVDEVPPTLYQSWRQATDASFRLAVRTSGDPHALAAPVRRAIAELDPAVGTWQVYTMEEIVAQSQSVFLRRYPMLLVGTFAGVALLLALVGTYGVVSYAVAQRVRELGIRMALGARPSSIRGMVLREAGTVAALGVALGMGGALALSRLAQGLFYGLEGASQPTLVAAAAALLGAMATLAALVPAMRATRVDPIVALRGE